MAHFLYHWIYQDIYQPVWPNWVAGIVAGIVAYFWKGRAWLKKHEEHQKKIADLHAHMLKGKK